jgi:glutathione S-transferase
VRWVLEEVGAEYDYVVMTPEEAGGEDHRARHPLGRVPVLETDDGFLFESAALCLQIADMYPASGLLPPLGSYQRGQVYQWAFFAMTELEAAIIQVYRPPTGADASARAAADERLEQTLAVLEAALEGRSYLVGDAFTVADVLVGSLLGHARRADLLPGSRNVTSYFERLEMRPARQATDTR